jgi:hypothetical protein
MKATITPSFTPRSQTPVSRMQPPPIPSRPDSSASLLESDAYNRPRSDSVKSQVPPPLPRRSSPAPAILSNSSDPHSALPKVRREPPPRPVKPLEEAQPSFTPSSSIINEIQRQRSLASGPSSPVKPDTLPPRPKPTVSMDMDGPPPDGLVTPVLPTMKTQPPLPIRNPTASAPTTAVTSSVTPAATAAKPIPVGNGSRKTGSVADRLKQWEQIGSQSTVKTSSSGFKSPTKPSLSTSPTKKTAPVKPAKPDTLRKASISSMSTPPA